MKAFRVMVNDLQNGTAVWKDKLTERQARNEAKAQRKAQPKRNFFVSEYEEAREGANKLEA